MFDADPQPVLAPLTEAALFLTVTVSPGTEGDVRDLLSDVSGLRRSVGFRAPEDELTCIVGIGADAWDRLFGAPRPLGLHAFAPISGSVHHAPATPGDLLFHIRSRRHDLCFELGHQLVRRLPDGAAVVDEVHGFRSFDERDLLGFVDGTENPEGNAALAAALIADEDPAFAGGSYVVVQRYHHDLTAWDALPVEEQERAIGRSKLDDIEMPDDVKPSNSHFALNTIVDDNGDERQIVRLNMPFGNLGEGEFGTYFVGYAATPDVIEEMLTNMFVGKPPGNHDRILDFSTAVTGALFFVPTVDFLDDPPDGSDTDDTDEPEVADETDPVPTTEPSDDDGSLGIGALRDR